MKQRILAVLGFRLYKTMKLVEAAYEGTCGGRSAAGDGRV